MDLTVHITIPRRDWPTDRANWQDEPEVADARLGRAVREETHAAMEKLERRAGSRPDLRTIEITLVDTARAEIVDDPEAHKP